MTMWYEWRFLFLYRLLSFSSLLAPSCWPSSTVTRSGSSPFWAIPPDCTWKPHFISVQPASAYLWACGIFTKVIRLKRFVTIRCKCSNGKIYCLSKSKCAELFYWKEPLKIHGLGWFFLSVGHYAFILESLFPLVECNVNFMPIDGGYKLLSHLKK